MAIRKRPAKRGFRPQAGTMSERILTHIKLNPGVSTNGIMTALDLNPSPARACIKALLNHGLVEDTPNEQGHHAYRSTPKGDLV